jgi:hypothetical protein
VTVPAQSSPKATSSAKAANSGAASGPYKLIEAATAGGYKADTDAPAAQTSAAETVSGTVKEQVESTGSGTVTSTVAGSYLVNNDLLAAYTGFNGSFTPDQIAQAFSSEATKSATVNPGSHGGVMGCGVISGGTICVWVTAKTLAVIEYFDATGQSEIPNTTAATYALNIRNSVEVPAG